MGRSLRESFDPDGRQEPLAGRPNARQCGPGRDAASTSRAASDVTQRGAVIETDIPARLDRLPWGRFHALVVVALGITWILDGLEVTLAGALSGALKQSPVLHFSNT